MELIPNEINNFLLENTNGKSPSPVKTYHDDAHTKLQSIRPYDNGVDGPMTGAAYNCDENGNIIILGLFHHSKVPFKIYQFDLNHNLMRAAFFDDEHNKTREEVYKDNGDTKIVHLYGASIDLENYFSKLFPDNTKIIFDTVARYRRSKSKNETEDYALNRGEYKTDGKEWLEVSVFRGGSHPFAKYVFDYKHKLARTVFFDDEGKATTEEIYENENNYSQKTVYTYDVVNPYDDNPSERASDNKQVLYDVVQSFKRWGAQNIQDYSIDCGRYFESGIRSVFYAKPKQSPKPTDLKEETFAGQVSFSRGKRNVQVEWYKNGRRKTEIKWTRSKNDRSSTNNYRSSIKAWDHDGELVLDIKFSLSSGKWYGRTARYNGQTGKYETYIFTPANSQAEVCTPPHRISQLGVTAQPSRPLSPRKLYVSELWSRGGFAQATMMGIKPNQTLE